MNEQELKEKIIKEQDLICSTFGNMKYLFKNYIDNPKVTFSDVKKMLYEDETILNSLRINNLTRILTDFNEEKDEQNIAKLRDKINERMEKEHFFVEDSESAPFLVTVHSVNRSFKMLGNDLITKIKNQTVDELKELEGTDAELIGSKFNLCCDAANFMKYYKEGVFTKEKLNTLEDMLSRNAHALEYTNFALFKNEIYNSLPKDFIEYISKFPKLSNELVMISDNNCKLYSVFANRVNSYDKMIDNYSEIETMLDGFSTNCFELQLDTIDNKTCDNLINWAEQKAQKEDINFPENCKDIPLEYSNDYSQKLDEYWDKKYDEVSLKKEELANELDIKNKRLEELNKLIESEQDLIKKRDYEFEKIDLNFEVKYLPDNLKKIDDEKKDIYFRKNFSMSYKDAKTIIKEYGSDLDNIDGIREEKEFFTSLKNSIDNVDSLDMLFNQNNKKYDFVSINKIKNTIAKECAKSYAENLNEVKNNVNDIIKNKDKELYEQVEFDGEKVDIVKLKGKFDLFVHSTDTGFILDKELDEDYNFKDNWQEENKADHILSTAYMTQDFMGMPPLKDNGVMYGFASLPRENIRLMGVTDINTYNRKFAYDSRTKQYMTAKTMPYSSRRVYSEFAIEKQNPDYVMLPDDASDEIKNNTLKAAKQFGIPVLYIDKQEIVNNQVGELNTLLEDFEKTNDTNTLKRIINKYETNVSGWLLNRKDGEDESHTKDIDNSRFKDSFKEVEDKIQNVVSNYLDKAENSKEDLSEDLTKIATTILEEKQLYEDSLSGGPDGKISGTQMSLNSNKIVEKLNVVFEKKGMNQFVISEDTQLQQYLKMEEVAKNAICRERVSSESIKESRNVEAQNRDLEEKNIW